jgi:hypothetical protein
MKRCRRVNVEKKYYILMYEKNGKMRPVDTIQGIEEGE